jgi:hypothetical protein
MMWKEEPSESTGNGEILNEECRNAGRETDGRMNRGAALVCNRCSKPLVPGRGDFYLVPIDAVADPSAVEMEPLGEEEIGRRIDRLLKRLAGTSHEEAMKQVIEHKTIYLCSACYRGWIENPIGAQSPR